MNKPPDGFVVFMFVIMLVCYLIGLGTGLICAEGPK